MLFGWNRVSPRMHFVSTLIVAIGTLISAFWILSANSWMQTPQGFKYDLIFKAYNNMIKAETDDLQVLLKYKPNASIKFIQGSDKNFKITTQHEVELLKHLYKNKDLWENLYE